MLKYLGSDVKAFKFFLDCRNKSTTIFRCSYRMVGNVSRLLLQKDEPLLMLTGSRDDLIKPITVSREVGIYQIIGSLSFTFKNKGKRQSRILLPRFATASKSTVHLLSFPDAEKFFPLVFDV